MDDEQRKEEEARIRAEESRAAPFGRDRHGMPNPPPLTVGMQGNPIRTIAVTTDSQGNPIRTTATTTQPTTTTTGSRTNIITTAMNPASDRILNAINDMQGHYSENGGPPLDRGTGAISRNGRQHGEDRRSNNIPAIPITDPAASEGKYSVLTHLSETEAAAVAFTPNQNEMFFAKLKWTYDGSDTFEDYIVRVGGYARTLNVRDPCFKNTIFQSFVAPCSFLVNDMEPSMEPYFSMSKLEYVKCLHERLEPVSAVDLIYTQFKEWNQKANEIYDLYLRDKFNLFVRSFPRGKDRIFKDFMEEAIRGLHNELLRNKIRDFLSIQHLSGKKIDTFDAFRQMVQVSVENIQSRALAGELDANEVAGTNIRMMNYSYLNNKDNSGRYAINHLIEGNKEEGTINEFRDFRKFKNYNPRYQYQYSKKIPSERQPTENDQCYNCGTKGHFSKNCPRRNIPEDKKVNKVEEESSTDYESNDKQSGLESDPEENFETNYVNRRKDGKNREERSSNKLREMNSKINELSNQFSELMAIMKSQKSHINSLEHRDTFPAEINDINQEAEDDVFAFL